MSELSQIRDDLIDEQESLDALVAPLDHERWRTTTPSPGWDVADQIGHLAYFDATATQSIVDPPGYLHGIEQLLVRCEHASLDDVTLEEYRSMSPPQVLERWRSNRAALNRAGATMDERTRVDWYGRAMSARSFLTARLMETWAHGTDVADALGERLVATDRLRHIAHLGFITREWSYRVRGDEPPPTSIYVALTSPSGATWTFGPADAPETITGTAEDFCLVCTQRRHVDDTHLIAGPTGREWLERAQAFAGPASDGPRPSSAHESA